MGKAVGVSVVLFVILSLGIWLLLTNAHIDIFPCTRFPEYAAPCGIPSASTCSMMAIYDDGPCTPKLATAGYAVAVFVMLLVPATLAALVGRKLAKR